MLIWLVRVYRFTLSPALSVLFGPAQGCRFTPTCSQYALEALERHGAWHGSILAAHRVCRCHPWGGCGHDPVPLDITAAQQRRPTTIGMLTAVQQSRPTIKRLPSENLT